MQYRFFVLGNPVPYNKRLRSLSESIWISGYVDKDMDNDKNFDKVMDNYKDNDKNKRIIIRE